tara:strand:+ start:245 stop:436 length:192 start_codon:yes stop_codon:yes gene_type:complete
MKTGSLVKRIDNWVKHNPWMKDNEEFGIVIYLPKSLSYKPCIKVLWSTLGIMIEHPDDIELIQ